MKIKLESTSQIVELDGIECRVWEGTTEGGVPLTAFIPRVAVHRDHDQSQFERELTEQREPRASGPVWPARMVL
jgi:hypothetical protein